MKNNKSILIVLLSFAFALSSADNKLCVITQNSTGIPLPNLPNQFQTVIEHNYRSYDLKSNYTTEYEEYYDLLNNRAAIIKRINFKLVKQYYLYATDEMITVLDNECAVTPLEYSLDNPFGLLTVNSSYQINSPSYVLKFGLNSTTEYIGSDITRGINVQKWQSCVYFEEIETTVKFTWTFSEVNIWNSSIVVGNSSVQFPVEMSIEALTDEGQSWSERIEYSFYRPYIAADPEIFETPKGVYCSGRKATKPLPKVPEQFSYRIEATLIDLNQTTSQSEWYDFKANLARIDYEPLSSQDIQEFGNDLVSEVHDFNQGVRYIVNKNKEKCLNITTLNSDSFDSVSANQSGYVRIRTALEMFHFDKVNYQFHGSRKIRNIDCDVWIAKRTDWPIGFNYTTTWEWYFMSEKWTAINSGQTEFNIPVQLVLTQYIPFAPVITLTTTTIYNYFDFIEKKSTDGFNFGVQNCFDGSASKHLQIKFENLNSIDNKNEFKNEFLNKLTSLTYLLPTRIDQIEIDFSDKDTIVLFKLLDKSPITENIINPVAQISLEDAESLLKKKIDNGEFVFASNYKTYTAVKSSLTNINEISTSPFTNYLVIIAISCSVIGGVFISLIIQIVFVKIRASKGGQPSLTMSGLLNLNYDK